MAASAQLSRASLLVSSQNIPLENFADAIEGTIVDESHHLSSTQIPSTQLALFAPPRLESGGSLTAAPGQENAIDKLLASHRNENTKAAYLTAICQFFNTPPGEHPSYEQVAEFLSSSPHQIAMRLADFKAQMIEEGKKESTINGRLAAIRALLEYAHVMGWCVTNGTGLVRNEKVQSYRDTRGIGLEWGQRLLREPFEKHGETVRAFRDSAMLALMMTPGLRCSEVCKLNVGDFSNRMLCIMILGKGRGTGKEPLTISPEVARTITEYLLLAGHGGDKGPLFRNFDHRPGKAGERITDDGLYWLVKDYGKRLGIDNLTPHKLRHTFGTLASKATNGNAPKVQKALRHKSMATSQIYIDNEQDWQGEVANAVSDLLFEIKKPKTRRR